MRNAPVSALSSRLPFPAIRWLALLALCSAYIQGGLVKLLDFPVQSLRCSILLCRRQRRWPLR